VLFAAWGGGELSRSGAQAYFEGYSGGLSLLTTVAVLQLDRLGAGGDVLEISQEPRRAAELLADSAARLDVPIRLGDVASHPYQRIVKSRVPATLIRWADSEVDPRRDRLSAIDPVKLQAAGETINLALITVSREANW
jgi:hypothetical protein